MNARASTHASPRSGRRRSMVRPAAIASLALLAGVAAGVWVQARRAERRNPPRGRFLQLDGVRLHYLDRGRGKPEIVILHGNGSLIHDFELSGIVDRLADERRVILIERPGFGHSSRPRGTSWTPSDQASLMLQAMRCLGIERPVVVGHSWGALVALAMALQDPSRVRGLVLLSGYYYPTSRRDVPFLAPPAWPVVGDVLRYTIAPFLSRLALPFLVRRIFAPNPVPPSFAAGFPFDLLVRPSHLRAAAEDMQMMIPGAEALHRRYRTLTVPVTIVAGAEDQLIDVGRHPARLHRDIIGSQLILIPGAGHMVHQTAPDEVADIIAATVETALSSEYPSLANAPPVVEPNTKATEERP